MGVAFGALFLWIGGAMIWVASHGTDATTPWGVFMEILGAIRHGG